MNYYKGLLIALFASTIAAKCGPGYGSCSNGQCCSKYGYCGTTEDYCGSGCQAGYGNCNSSSNNSPSASVVISTDGRCGIGFNTKCPNGYCCSKYGYCGTSSDHCNSGCQTGYGSCGSSSSNTTTTTKKTTTTTTKKTTTTTINGSSSLPTSTDGRCGTNFGTVCPNGKCCSKYGYCGTSSDHCNSGCQSGFGTCSSSSVTVATSTTTKKTTTTTISTSSNTSLPTSTSGLCGKFDGVCPNHQCCSRYGYCGSTDEYCTAAMGCQSEFGRCGEYVSNLKFKYYHECKNPKHWALTFDDGPYDYDMDLLDLLKQKGVKATFFINGDNVMDIKTEKAKEIVKRMYKEGHTIGSHTWSHANLEEISRDEIILEMTKLEEVLQEYIGKKPAFLRPPYGSGDGNDELALLLDDLGYSGACMWNVDTIDWSTSGDVEYALKMFKSYLGRPILSLNHNFYKDITRSKLLTLAEAEIDFMLENGYTPVTMDVCLGLAAYQ